MKSVTIHTDGSCVRNPGGQGGWAAVLRYGEHRREVTGYEASTTNNRMELQAAIGALEVLKEPCEVRLYTDSRYVRDGITRWLSGWKRKGWKTLDRAPVKNVDLWQQLDRLTQRHTVSWVWVRGHAGHGENERCDALARRASNGNEIHYERTV